MSTLLNLIILGAVVIVVVAVVIFVSKFSSSTLEILKEEGSLIWLDHDKWTLEPFVPLSKKSISGVVAFDDDRYSHDVTSYPHLYGGKNITENQVWVVKGRAPVNYKFWTFGVYLMTENVALRYEPVESSYNSEMIKTARDGDELVMLFSPNYKLAEHVANKLRQTEYTKIKKGKQVVFKYFSLPDYNPRSKYSMIFDAYNGSSGSLPKFAVSRYTYIPGKENVLPFYPTKKVKPMSSVVDTTINEIDLVGGMEEAFDVQLEKYIGAFRMKYVTQFKKSSNTNSIYTDSGPIEISQGEEIKVGLIDHSSIGKCLYSEILFIDDLTGRVYDSQTISEFNPATVNKTGKIKIVTHVPASSRIRIMEHIVVDMSTYIKPSEDTIIPARVYVVR